MGAGLTVHQTRPAPAAVAGWLNRIIGPSLEACRFDGPWPPIELRPLTDVAGVAFFKNLTTDGRICISSRATYWSSQRIKYVILHEIAHRLVMNDEATNGYKTDFHGPIFFLTNAVLLARAEAAEKTPNGAVNELSLYDFQDAPKSLSDLPRGEWAPKVLGWALSHVETLAKSDLPAEKIVSAACTLWVEFCEVDRKNAEAATARKEAEKRTEAALRARLSQVEGSKVFWVGFMLSGWGLTILGGMALHALSL